MPASEHEAAGVISHDFLVQDTCPSTGPTLLTPLSVIAQAPLAFSFLTLQKIEYQAHTKL